MVNANILIIREGVYVSYPECKGGLGVRVVHPSSSRARSENLSVSMLYLIPGGVLKPHCHSNEEVYVILSGMGKGSFGFDEPVKVEEGQFIHLPPNCEHGIENTGGEMMVILIATSPPIQAELSKEEAKCGKV